jgi:hypothetical protein
MRTAPNGYPHAFAIVPLAVACCVVIAACGSSGTSSGTNSSSDYSQALKHAGCMRSHGVSNFPDPSAGGHPQAIQVNPRSPAFQTAQRACRKLAPGGLGSPTHLSASQRRAALEFAQCMRAHGEPNFPDPTLNPPSAPTPGTMILAFAHKGGFVLGPGIDPRSPAFRQAASACGVKPPAGTAPKVG